MILADLLALLPIILQAVEVDVATVGADDNQALAELIKLDAADLVAFCERLVNREDCVFLCRGVELIVVYVHGLSWVILAEVCENQRVRKPPIDRGADHGAATRHDVEEIAAILRVDVYCAFEANHGEASSGQDLNLTHLLLKVLHVRSVAKLQRQLLLSVPLLLLLALWVVLHVHEDDHVWVSDQRGKIVFRSVLQSHA